MHWLESDTGLKRTLEFTDQTELAEFVLRLAKISDAMGHHADMRVVYNQLDLSVITHDAQKVTAKDWALCAEIDRLLSDN